MANKEYLLQQIQRFQFYARPSNANSSAPCTVGDINDLIDNIAKLLKAFVKELDN